MGEIADAMLDGTLCECCGTCIGDETGFPGYCSDQCAADRGLPPGGFAAEDRYQPRLPRFNCYGANNNPKVAKPTDPIRQGDKMACPFCVRKVKVSGFGDHMLDQHRDKWGAVLALEPTR